MNVLPIPALDGGHALFILIEIITRRRPSDKVLLVAQMIGMSLLFLLMFWATFNDIARLF
jgi:regulator of sigma E protease